MAEPQVLELHRTKQAIARPTPYFAEWWETEAVDAAIWASTPPATGTFAISTGADGFLRLGIIPNANETGRLRSLLRFPVPPSNMGPNSLARRIIFEFRAALGNVANIDNTLSIIGGLTYVAAADRTTNALIIFALVGDALQTVTDDGGAETVNTGFGETLTDNNLFGIEIIRGAVRFYLNGARIATHIANLPNVPMYINHFIDTEGGGAGNFYLSEQRLYVEDTP